MTRLILHPLTLFASVWLLCFGLYAMRLSELLTFPVAQVGEVVAWVVVPFTAAILAFNLYYALAPKIEFHRGGVDLSDDDYLERAEKKIDRWFLYWIGLTIVEVATSGGVPLLWLMTGSAKNYTEFGLPVVHVFVWTLLLVLAMGKFGLYLIKGGRGRLLIPAVQLFWGVVIVSRGLILAALVQAAILWLCLRGISVRAIIRTLVASTLVVLLFGYAGDARSGGTAFRSLARPTKNYPAWLPSGVLWMYIYVTSPLANLANTTISTKPADDIYFSRTLLFMLPTPMRNAIYGKDFATEQGTGDLVDERLIVSSAYIGPYLDYGFVGIASYSVVLGLLAAYLWKRRERSLRDQVLYVIMAQCLMFSIFWNFLFYNPFLGQVFWIFLIFGRKRVKLVSSPKSAGALLTQ
ncbi:MAG TPA: O-antigen polymerase [Acidobacteriaceae bacterium]|nr:O-antigen polymerase [Acidobacteriaceae bacterium]